MKQAEPSTCPSLLHFLLVRGVLIWGGLTTLLVTVWQVVFEHQSLADTLHTSLILYPPAGLLVGLLQWWQTRKYGRRR
ncbi:hypothetical protein Q4485_16365 [Granulosicoccaceae sp. 1_MG-2023]|nr:hypothetical protein [Granulosicoccaceae sp. 1_MG-2023]